MEWADLTEEYTSALTSSDSLLNLGTTDNSFGLPAATEPASVDPNPATDGDAERSRA